MKNTAKETPTHRLSRVEAHERNVVRRRSLTWKTIIKTISYMSIGLFAVTLVSIKVFSVNLSFHPKEANANSEFKRIATLHPGDPVPQIFTAKVRISNFLPGETPGFEIMDTEWPHPFWRPAVVRDGYAYCDFGIGSPQDVGRLYKITGRRLPANLTVPTGIPLDAPVPGEVFFGPSFHKRL